MGVVECEDRARGGRCARIPPRHCCTDERVEKCAYGRRTRIRQCVVGERWCRWSEKRFDSVRGRPRKTELAGFIPIPGPGRRAAEGDPGCGHRPKRAGGLIDQYAPQEWPARISAKPRASDALKDLATLRVKRRCSPSHELRWKDRRHRLKPWGRKRSASGTRITRSDDQP